MKSFVLAFALTCLIGAATGLEGDARDLSADCSKILEWKLYYPGDVTYFPVPEKNVPGNMKRIKNGTCIEVSETEHFNFMMYTLDWGPGCGETQPECGSFKLYYIDEAKVIQRSGKEVVWPFFLYGDTPCYPDGHIDSTCNPSDYIADANADDVPLKNGTYYLSGSTYGTCSTFGGPPSGELDYSIVYFEVQHKC